LPMKILVTGGNTRVPIDKVRVISNVFRGRTAVSIASEGCNRRHDVTLIGNPGMNDSPRGACAFLEYRTFDELEEAMRSEISGGGYDCVIHSAAVSDYSVSRVLGPNMQPLDSSGKVGSSYERMYLELVPTRKIVDEVRGWGFKGVLVKFKLQVGISDAELLAISRASREHSGADLIVANCLEWSRDRAYIVGEGAEKSVDRSELPSALLDEVERRVR